MNTTPNTTKRNRISLIDFVLLSEATVRDFPGKFIQVTTTGWNSIQFSSVEFSEYQPSNGEFVDQELNIFINGTDSSIDQELQLLCGNEVLIRLTYANGDVKIVGTEENPILLESSSTGSPVRQTLSTKRKSAEKSKYPLA